MIFQLEELNWTLIKVMKVKWTFSKLLPIVLQSIVNELIKIN